MNTNSPEDAVEKNDTTDSSRTPHAETKKKSGFLGEFVRFALIALIIVLPIRIYIAQPFIVSGASMNPTFTNGQYLIVDELSYRFNEPQRGDVIIFRPPHEQNKFFIKRIIGLPRETVTIRDNQILIENEVYPEGIGLNEQYISSITNSTVSLELGEDEYFVMGDNRPASSDSRVWGPLPGENIVGRAFLRLLPVHTFALLPGAHAHEIDTSLNQESL